MEEETYLLQIRVAELEAALCDLSYAVLMHEGYRPKGLYAEAMDKANKALGRPQASPAAQIFGDCTPTGSAKDSCGLCGMQHTKLVCGMKNRWKPSEG